MSTPRVKAEESGFTLIEILVVVVLEALIVTAIGSAFVLVMNNSTTVKESLARTNDARFAATYIVNDAANSSGPETSLSDTASCPDANPPVSGTPTAVVRFDWNSTDSTGATTPHIVNYVLVSNALLRRECSGGTLVSDDALATNIASATVACSPNSDCSGLPTTITATITETQGSSSAAAYQYSLTGAFRKTLAAGAPLGPAGPQDPYPLFALGGACAGGSNAIKISGSASLHIQGTAYINAADSGNCNALDMTASSAWKADTTKVLTGGSCSAGGTAVCPTTTPYSPAFTDPYASLAAPSTTGLPAEAGCPGGVAQPGVYAAALSITGASTCNLASGVYILQAGFAVGNSAVVTNDPSGVLIYITGGGFSIGGAGSTNLSAMTSGTYAGLVVWQAAADTTTMTIGNSTSPVFTGAVYAPKAQMTISGSGSPSFTELDVQNLVISGSTSPLIGTPLSVSTASLPAWTVNKPYATTVAGAGGEGTYSWSASGLPAGLSINASTGAISGTPTASGAASVTITLNDAFGDPAANAPFTLTINAVPTISTASPLPNAGLNVAYSTTVAASAGTAPYSWLATGLPAGLTMDAATGVISGTPTATGTTSASVTVTDHAGVTANKSLSITVNAAPVITSVVLANGGATPGKLEKGDTITITYSTQLSVSSFCSTWSGDGSNQSLSTNNDVTVNIANGTSGANDVLSVTSATCTFNFGSLDLGSGSYVTSAVPFGGSGGSKSSITWTTATHTLTITLGAQKSGTVNAVASSAPIYSASASIVDTFGAAISNSPYTLAAAQQF